MTFLFIIVVAVVVVGIVVAAKMVLLLLLQYAFIHIFCNKILWRHSTGKCNLKYPIKRGLGVSLCHVRVCLTATSPYQEPG